LKPQLAFFSATLPPVIRSMISRYMADPQNVGIAGKTLTVANTNQMYFDVDHYQKTDVLCRLLDIHSVKRGIVFCNTKRMVDDLVSQLQSRGYMADALHGDLAQKMRDRVMASFRKGGIKLLVATDVAARGIDVDDVDFVINYDLPKDEEDYVHRIGRTSRAGKTGTAISLVCGREIYKLKAIEQYARVRINRQRTPTFDDALESNNTRLREKIRATITAGHLAPYVALVEAACGEDVTPMDVGAALLKIFAPVQKPQSVPMKPAYSTARPDNAQGHKKYFGKNSYGVRGEERGRLSSRFDNAPRRPGDFPKKPRSK
ncbi:MAG: DEAD/DEAH box helicase, partial [Chitinispirillaceae bacterium]|nr:DEAD/DEAH box helicase [Chitinispirillaceae bacterium]